MPQVYYFMLQYYYIIVVLLCCHLVDRNKSYSLVVMFFPSDNF